MKQRHFPVAAVSKKAEASVLGGHPWIYDSEVQEPVAAQDGDLVDAVTVGGKYLGTGFLNRHSKIRIRLISHNANDAFDAAFFRRRFQYAWAYRKAVMGTADLSACRVIFGEADQFPGLTVDRFGDILVTQTLSLGIDRRKAMLFPLLVDVLRQDGQSIRGIYERNDVAIRAHEGLPETKGFFPLENEPTPDGTVTEIVENGIRYRVDFENGQKTGFFLDQKYNRRAVAKLAKDRHVLDCFTHTGSFALNAALGGAASVDAVDVSAEAVALAQNNARLNHMEDRIRFQAANVFDLLPELEKQPRGRYDFIILDPPAFTKSRQTVHNAMRGYKEINLRAMRLLPRGGYLATCSCSHFATDELFRDMLRHAAADAGVALRQIEARQQAPDHPILWNVPETDYLKFYLFQIV